MALAAILASEMTIRSSMETTKGKYARLAGKLVRDKGESLGILDARATFHSKKRRAELAYRTRSYLSQERREEELAQVAAYVRAGLPNPKECDTIAVTREEVLRGGCSTRVSPATLEFPAR